MALLSGLQKRFDQVGFMKPVGQVCLEVPDDTDPHKTLLVDKDAVLVKEHFRLDHLKYANVSPVTIPRGYTKDYLDGHISFHEQEALIHRAYDETAADSSIVLCEGTGHMAVGSICQVNNAQVASWLDAKMVLVANGGLGNTFDELELNKALCDREGVDVCGVIVNKVVPDKLEQTKEYMKKALDLHWGGDIPLFCIPDRPFLGCPALQDFERLFSTKLLTGRQHLLRHYRVPDLNLVATSLQVFLRDMRNNPSRTLYVAHASRNDILVSEAKEVVAVVQSFLCFFCMFFVLTFYDIASLQKLGFLLESPLIAERLGYTNKNESALVSEVEETAAVTSLQFSVLLTLL